LREYELVVVLNPILTQDEARNIWEGVKGLFTERDGTNTHEDWWGTRRLAYPIRNQGQTYTEGAYVLGRFELEPARVAEIEASLRLMENVLRFIVVKADIPLKPPQPPIQAPAAVEAEPEPETPAAAEVEPESETPVAAEVEPEPETPAAVEAEPETPESEEEETKSE
jgi:small subunit ribosomal protein S6